MKPLVKFFLSLFFILCININCQAQLYELVFGNDLKKDAQEVVNQMIAGMNRLTNNAIDRGDFITESRLKEVELMLDGLKNFIRNERIKTLENLDIQRINILKGLDQMMAGNFPSIYQINDLAAILTANTQDIANSFGGVINTRDKFDIYRINGISQEYKSTGLYRISFIGNIFGKTDIKNTIIVNDNEMILYQGANSNNMYVEFPSSEIESDFKEKEASRIPIKIISLRTKKKFFRTVKDTLVSFENTILLHPKLPIQYKLVEIAKNFQWSEAFVGELKEDYTTPDENTTISTNVADGYKIDKEKTRFYDPIDDINEAKEIKCNFRELANKIKVIKMEMSKIDEECQKEQDALLAGIGNWVDEPVYFNEGSHVRRTYKASSRKKIWIEVYYNKPIQVDPIEIPRKLEKEKNGYLSYGVYESELFSDNYASFRLKVKYFYDNWKTINPTSATTIRGIRTDIEIGAIKRLTVNISSLTGF